jgi:hypothetical protein
MTRGISKTIEWDQHNDLSIILNETDKIEYHKTNSRGNIATNKRAYAHLKCTVIEGQKEVSENSIYVSKDSRIWSCQVISIVGMISTIREANIEVTVIIHTN